MPASWLDALTPPTQVESKPRATQNGVCRSCGADVWWTQAYGKSVLIEVIDQHVVRHQCHGALPEDFEVLR